MASRRLNSIFIAFLELILPCHLTPTQVMSSSAYPFAILMLGGAALEMFLV